MRRYGSYAKHRVTLPAVLDRLAMSERQIIDIGYFPKYRTAWFDGGALDKISDTSVVETNKTVRIKGAGYRGDHADGSRRCGRYEGHGSRHTKRGSCLSRMSDRGGLQMVLASLVSLVARFGDFLDLVRRTGTPLGWRQSGGRPERRELSK